jgi:hypothetical protein
LARPDPLARETSCTRSSGPSEAALRLPGTMPDERHFLERAHPVAAAKTSSCKAPDCYETGIRTVRATLPCGNGISLQGQPRRNPDSTVASRSAYKGLSGLLRDLFSFFHLRMACGVVFPSLIPSPRACLHPVPISHRALSVLPGPPPLQSHLLERHLYLTYRRRIVTDPLRSAEVTDQQWTEPRLEIGESGDITDPSI